MGGNPIGFALDAGNTVLAHIQWNIRSVALLSGMMLIRGLP
jgi:hypothetical protein